MGIRKAVLEDYQAIKDLLDELEYPNTESFLLRKMELIISMQNSYLYVYVAENQVIAFIALDFVPQLALAGDFMRISYFAVHHAWRSKGIGNELEAFCTELSKQKGCDRIEVHCHERRKAAHQFYYRQGYVESPKYLIKMVGPNLT